MASEILNQASRIDSSYDASLVVAIIFKLQRDGRATAIYVIEERDDGDVSNVRFSDGSYLYHKGRRNSWHTIREEAR
jgi:hypothetical protein